MKIIPKNRVALKLMKNTVLLDPIISDFHSFVSHAHGDHSPREIITSPFCTKETYELLKISFPFLESQTIPLNKKVKFDDFSVKLISAGHILGSAQIYIETDNVSVLYTGDIKLNPNLTTLPIKIESADVLVIETTYGYPGFKLPDQQETIEKFVKWVKEQLKNGYKVEIGAYPLGKAQEAIKILNNEGLIPTVTETVRRYSEVYKKFGVKLNFVSKEEKTDILIKPPSFIGRSGNQNIKSCVLTGWSEFRDLKTLGFPISDHADFFQLMKYVEMISPKKVFCVHGYVEEFAKEVEKNLGIKAIPLNNNIEDLM